MLEYSGHPGVNAAVESVRIIANSESLRSPPSPPPLSEACSEPSTAAADETPGSLPPSSDRCAEFRYVAGLLRRTHPFYFGGGGDVNATTGSTDVTLATQLTVDRFPALERMLSSWSGPASVALHVSDAELESVTDRIRSSKWNRRTNVAIHMVFRRLVGI